MIKISRKILNKIQINQYFYTKENKMKILGISVYKTNVLDKLKLGFFRERTYTFLLNLSENEDKILLKMDKKIRYESKRAEKENVKFTIINNKNIFLEEFTRFSKMMGIPNANIELINQNNIIITGAEYQNQILVMHVYIHDGKNLRLLHSCSKRLEDIGLNKIIGWSNRFLHLQDILYFKNNNFEVYDFGGCDFRTKKQEILNISRFKKEFGGELIEEINYMTIPYWIFYRLNQFKRGY